MYRAREFASCNGLAYVSISTFQYHVAVTRMWVEVARRLADSYILPFHVTAYSDALQKLVAALTLRYGDVMRTNGLQPQIGS